MRNFHPATQKSDNFFLLGLFVQRRKGLHYKNREELSFMVLNSDAKFEKLYFDGSFCPKHIMFQLENFLGIMSHDTEG